jgi:hypothetical protein
MLMKNLFSFLICVFAFISCRTTKQINKVIQPKEVVNTINKDYEDSIRMVKTDFEKFKKNHILFTTFQAKIKVESSGSQGKNQDLTAVVRMVKDSAIWISLSASILNVEVYRLLITKDSVILMNKQQKEVLYRSLDYLQEVTKIPFDFKTLQDLFIGNPIFISDSINAYRKLDQNILISIVTKEFKNLFTMQVSDHLMTHAKLDDLDVNRNRTADITYEDYQPIDSVLFSTVRHITVSEKNKLDIRLQFKQVEFNKELSVYFSVPKNYLRK